MRNAFWWHALSFAFSFWKSSLPLRLPWAFVGASLSEPHTGQMASPVMFIYLCRYVSYVIKCPCVLIHWTAASILLSVIQFRKCHHVQIIETASILHLQWVTTSMCMLLLVQAELADYSYSELSYVSAKLYRSSVD